jgi:chemotaxis protein MotB
MATDGKKLQPIIIKRIKKGGHAVHGGAWKIAYADFVTAMMAFFLLMWLLGSTAQGDLKGLSDYFNSPLKVALSGGSGAGNSTTITPGGGTDLSRSAGQGKPSSPSIPSVPSKKAIAEAAKAEVAKQDAKRMAALQAKIEALIAATPKLNDYRSQIRMEVTPDGLLIQIVDDQNRPMFASGSAVVKPYMRDILREIGSTLNGIENRVSLAGHTDATPYSGGDRGYSNWELSADRANASRRELIAAGMPDDKLARVSGLAATSLLDEGNPNSPANRRISITIMTREAEERLLTSRPVVPAETEIEAAASAPRPVLTASSPQR